MAKIKSPAPTVETFDHYKVITPHNPLKAFARRVADDDIDDPVARAEQALKALSGEFDGWMAQECERLASAHVAVRQHGFTMLTRDELFRAAHDIKGDAATFGYPLAAFAAESLCRVLEHAPDIDSVPADLIATHINAIQAIVREHGKPTASAMAATLAQQLRDVADAFLIGVNADRPDHLEAVKSPGIAPAA